jgi:hypothetical protein
MSCVLRNDINPRIPPQILNTHLFIVTAAVSLGLNGNGEQFATATRAKVSGGQVGL